MRPEVAAYVALGQLPDESADEETIARFEAALGAIQPPLTEVRGQISTSLAR